MSTLNNKSFNDVVFQRRVAGALQAVDRILDMDRNPRLAEDVSHDYTDKYALANTMTNTGIVAFMNILDRLGLTNDVLQKLDKSKATTLRFQAFDSCKFIKEQVVDVPVPTTLQTDEETTTTGSFLGTTKKSTTKQIVNRVKEFHWQVDTKWEISVYSGTKVDDRTILDSRTATTTLIVQSSEQKATLPTHREHSPHEIALTWLLKQMDLDKSVVHFSIDTQNKDTKTPRRNKQVDDALSFMSNAREWMTLVYNHFSHLYQRDIIRKHNPAIPSPSNSIAGDSKSLSALNQNVFVPILPFLEEIKDENEMEDIESTESPTSQSALALPAPEENVSHRKARVLSNNDTTLLLNEQVQSLTKALASLAKGFPESESNSLISAKEAKLCVLHFYSYHLVNVYGNNIQYIEKMLEDQLVAAIGKRVTSEDLDEFVRYHNAKMLSPAPKPFCHAIRRPNHYPEGILSIESSKASDDKTRPIETHVREVDGLSSLKFPLNAATTLELTGKTYLHGWLNHRFSTAHTSYELVGRARQFSSFMLVVGTMIGPDRMQPKDAIILQNKDEVKIPLLLNEIPTAKEFKDAIESLSPEQQRFAKAYRSMQLESSVLGVCVIQIKPQLEDLLGVPHDSLTKEMKLTQDLLELFVEYQVPSDLLSYDGENQLATTKEKVDNVKEHVKAVLEVIQTNKKRKLEDQEMKTDMAVERYLESSSVPQMDEYYSSADPPALSSVRRERKTRALGSAPRSGAMGGGRGGFAASMMMQASTAFGSARASPFGSASASASASPFGSASASRSTLPEQKKMSKAIASTAAAANANVATSSSNITAMDIAEDSLAFPDFSSPSSENTSKTTTLDFTGIPRLLDSTIEKYDTDGALRSTTIKTSNKWTRERQENLLTKPNVNALNANDIKSEKNKAFDLLDALSRSGSLPIRYSELHVIVCVTHCFEKSVMETVIEDNVNPIEKLEWSTLLLASTVHGSPANRLISNDNDRLRLNATFPALL